MLERQRHFLSSSLLLGQMYLISAMTFQPTMDQRKHGHMFRFVCDVRSLNYCYISIILTRWVQPCYFNFRLGDNVGACNSQRHERMLTCILFYIRKRVCPSSWLLCYSIINIRSLIRLFHQLDLGTIHCTVLLFNRVITCTFVQ
jgi:hypothetical protein